MLSKSQQRSPAENQQTLAGFSSMPVEKIIPFAPVQICCKTRWDHSLMPDRNRTIIILNIIRTTSRHSARIYTPFNEHILAGISVFVQKNHSSHVGRRPQVNCEWSPRRNWNRKFHVGADGDPLSGTWPIERFSSDYIAIIARYHCGLKSATSNFIPQNSSKLSQITIF